MCRVAAGLGNGIAVYCQRFHSIWLQREKKDDFGTGKQSLFLEVKFQVH